MKHECARCGGRSDAWLCGMNGMFKSCYRCASKKVPYSEWEHILGKLPKTPNPNNYCTKHLKQWLHFNNWLYYRMDDPEITDSDYDKAFRELQKREESEGSTKDSPTQIVGAVQDKPQWPPLEECKECKPND